LVRTCSVFPPLGGLIFFDFVFMLIGCHESKIPPRREKIKQKNPQRFSADIMLIRGNADDVFSARDSRQDLLL
jgi:hypothetical protein